MSFKSRRLFNPLRFVFTDKNRLPTSKAMEKARLDTFLFGDGWIHDRSRNHGASSKKVCMLLVGSLNIRSPILVDGKSRLRLFAA